MRNYYLKPPNISWGIIFPFAWMLMFFLKSQTPVFIALFFVNISNIHWLTVMTSVVLIAVTSSFLGLFIAVSVSEVFEAQTFSSFFRFPMVFLCGLFISISQLPVFLRPLSYLFPLTYGSDLLKTAINENGHIAVSQSVLVLLAFSIVMFLISKRNIWHRWIY
ncbi:MAG: ABC transporter permease [candidate division KSB1 bacterium]|nr:ABC transporter permease [candidate division KSB1 bacterium]